MQSVALGCLALVGPLALFAAPAGASTSHAAAPTLASEVIPAPIGYQVSSGTGGAPLSITPDLFDQAVGAGSTASYGFVNGYDITYDSTATSEALEVTLFRFHSSAEAKAFSLAEMSQSPAASLSPGHAKIHGIKASSVLVSTKAGSDGFYEVDAFAVNGSMVMFMEYSNTAAPTSVPSILGSSAVSQ